MTDTPALRFDYAILCDEIRKEDNNKLMLLGVYSGDVVVREFPVTLGLSSYIHGYAAKDGQVALEIRYNVEYEDGDAKSRKVSATGVLSVQNAPRSREIGVSIVKLPVEVNAPAKLSLSCKAEGGRWKKLLSKRVTLFPTSTNEPQLS